jgi:hypothetical protein
MSGECSGVRKPIQGKIFAYSISEKQKQPRRTSFVLVHGATFNGLLEEPTVLSIVSWSR